MFDFPALLAGHFCSAPLNDSDQAAFAIIGVSICVAALLVARRAYHRSYKATEIDDELIRRFVDAAPVWRLKALQSTEDKSAEQQLSSQDDN